MSCTDAARKRKRKDTSVVEGPEITQDAADDRACDSCRGRRVKCDRITPCANCKRRGEICHTTNALTTGSKSRSYVTKEHETKLNSMADQLANIEQLLRQQQTSLASLTQGHISGVVHPDEIVGSAVETVTGPPSPESQPPTATDYDASDATTGSHSTVAHKLVERAIEGSPGIYQDSELTAALNSLKDMVGRIEEGPNSLDYAESPWRPLHSGSETIIPPSQAEIERLLDEANGSISLGFTPGLTAMLLREKCQSVFGTGDEDVSPIRRAYVHGVFRNLCVEYGGEHEDATFAKRCRNLSVYFSIQVGHAVNDLKFIIPTTPEAASALTLASQAAMELCRPLIAQSLASKAASIVLSLGYNRLSSMRFDSEEVRQVKIFVFWMAYWLDTSFSVRLGRAPIIRPHDVAVPQLSENSIIPDGWVVAFNYSTRISGLQCKVVEQLFTPLAVQQTMQERKRRASQLVNELHDAWGQRGPGPTSIPLWRDSDAVMHHSTVCLVQHATLSAADLESPALDSARQALRLNVSAWETHKHLSDFIWVGHCHWTLLKGPITPFVVTFCHIIAHPFAANEDLQLLTAFVQTLENLRRFSDGMIRLHRLCDIFTKVASLYVQAKAKEAKYGAHAYNIDGGVAADIDPTAGWMGQLAVNDIDEYLSSIGFAPPPTSNTNGFPDGLGDPSEFDPNFLMDWYQGNNSLMGLLEQDLAFTGDDGYGVAPCTGPSFEE